MKEEEMNNAEICWLALLGGIVLVAVISFLSMIPELALLPAPQHVVVSIGNSKVFISM